MSVIKSPGQKRTTKVRIIVAIFFVIAAFLAASISKFANQQSLAWTKNAAVANATMVSLTEETEEYRNLRGRKRYRDRIWLAYKFEAEGRTITNRTDVYNLTSLADFDQDLTVLYEKGNPENHEFKFRVNATLQDDGLIEYMLSTLPISGGLTYVLYLLLTLLFVREAKGVLPEGFYSENCWLDVDDKYVVAIDRANLVCFDIDKKHLRDVQKKFQAGASVEDLVHASKHSKIMILPLDEVTEIQTDHNSDVIYATHDDKTHSLEFLNVRVKQHALKRILAALPKVRQHSKKERTRLQAMMPSLIGLLIFAGGAWLIDHFVAYIIAGFILVIWVLPSLISRLWDPHTTLIWQSKEALAASSEAAQA